MAPRISALRHTQTFVEKVLCKDGMKPPLKSTFFLKMINVADKRLG
jgi:hypothetical protein